MALLGGAQKSSTPRPENPRAPDICGAKSFADNYLRGDELDIRKKFRVN
jgi:hypothetical protein